MALHKHSKKEQEIIRKERSDQDKAMANLRKKDEEAARKRDSIRQNRRGTSAPYGSV